MRWQCHLAIVAILAVFSPTPGACQYQDPYMSGAWALTRPAPVRGSGGTATAVRKVAGGGYYQVDLTVNPAASGKSSVAAVLIDSDFSYQPSDAAIDSFEYSES